MNLVKQVASSPETSPIDFNQPRSYIPEFLAEKILTTRSSIQGERKFVTVLSAEVAHFTSIWEKLDSEDVHSIHKESIKLSLFNIYNK